MIELTVQEIFDEARIFFLPGRYFQSTSYDTSLLISGRESYDPYHHFELFGRKILWINQVEQEAGGDTKPRMARTIFPCDEQNFDGHIVAHRFSSLLCFATRGELILPRMWVGTAHPTPTSVQPAEKFIGTLFSHEDIDNAVRRLHVEEFTDKKWIALAHYRQAVLAATP